MRHGKKFNHLGRTAPHRAAMLSNMASSLILNKRINTTVAKAKALRKYVEPIITKAKSDTTHSRRIAFSYLQNKESVTELFGPIAEKVATRPGGYVRIIKTGSRLGDNAEMCMMELVDFNEMLLGDTSAKPKTRRSRRGGGKKSDGGAQDTAKTESNDKIEDAKVVEEKDTPAKEEAPAKSEAKSGEISEKSAAKESDVKEEKKEEPKEVATKVEEQKAEASDDSTKSEKNEEEPKKSDEEDKKSS